MLRNSSYLFSSNTLASALGVLQGILVFRLLGDLGAGLLAIVMDFPSNVNRLLSFRMSEVTVKYVGEALEQGDERRAAALVKGIGLAEAVTSVSRTSSCSCWRRGRVGPSRKACPSSLSSAFTGSFLLANLVYETSVGRASVHRQLQAGGARQFLPEHRADHPHRRRLFPRHPADHELGTDGHPRAYLVGKTIAGVVVTASASRELNRRLGGGWTRALLGLVPDWKPILRFAFSTNLNGTVNLFARDNIRLYIAALLSTAAVGYFSLASKLINLIMVPLDPLIAPTYAEITRTIAGRQWAATRNLLKQVSAISAAWTLLAGGGSRGVRLVADPVRLRQRHGACLSVLFASPDRLRRRQHRQLEPSAVAGAGQARLPAPHRGGHAARSRWRSSSCSSRAADTWSARRSSPGTSSSPSVWTVLLGLEDHETGGARQHEDRRDRRLADPSDTANSIQVMKACAAPRPTWATT
ncbi:MAG: hypothetical protein M0C28_33865 [Candidatus Moduliflexus flocculans]|nr:hypothetical protein [Candidatus Moduliflexus flocculans]